MPKIKYVKWEPEESAREMIRNANFILDEFTAKGFTLTIRQLYYQFVSKNLISNTIKSYGRLQDVIAKAREAGMVDWDHIQDRNRPTFKSRSWNTGKEFLVDSLHEFQLDVWQGQPLRVEVWVEKDALSEVVGKAAQEYGCRYMACKGYMSTSALWEAANQRFLHGPVRNYVVIHLGDHDPSGKDMTRDIQERLDMFATPYHGKRRPHIEVRRIALNMDQVQKYQCPPNPAKMTDPRADKYVVEHGDESWELDALDPEVIVRLISKEIESLLDMGLFEDCKTRQDEVMKKLVALTENFKD